MPSNGSSSTADPPLKATLHCPACDHRSPYDGDWRVRETSGRVHYRCPECHTPLVSQPTFEERPGPASPLWRAWRNALRVWQAFWW